MIYKLQGGIGKNGFAKRGRVKDGVLVNRLSYLNASNPTADVLHWLAIADDCYRSTRHGRFVH